MNKYFQVTNPYNGQIISEFISDLSIMNKYDNILFVRTPSTGSWLDSLLIDNNNVIRILYNTGKTYNKNEIHKSLIIIDQNELKNTLNKFNKKFDLICIDTFHEYEHSKHDFELLSLFLSDSGILVSHDCFPKYKSWATSKFNRGNWCGQTYLAFVEFAYNNPNFYYGVLNTDTGIGIISKIEIDILKNNLNKEKQNTLLFLHKTNNDNMYEYFCENSQEIINSIDLS